MNNPELIMKFKNNFLENKLWKLDGEYSYEISENSHFHTQKGTYGNDGWLLGGNERIIFTFSYYNLKVYYQKKELVYKKNLNPPEQGEIIVELTEKDLISHEKQIT